MTWSLMCTKRKGKISELEIIVELMKKGIDIFTPMVDDKGIDGIIRVQNGCEIKYFDIQIKTLRNGFNSDFNRLPYHDEFYGNYILLLAVTYDDKKPDIYFLTKESSGLIEKSPDKRYKGYINLSKLNKHNKQILEKIKIDKLVVFLNQDTKTNGGSVL